MDIKKNITKEKDGVTRKIEIVKVKGFLFDRYAIKKTTISIYKSARIEGVCYLSLTQDLYWDENNSNYFINKYCFTPNYNKICRRLVNYLSENNNLEQLNEKVIKRIKNGN